MSCSRCNTAPVGPQWVEDAILERIAEGSALSGRRVHMHLFETTYQKEWAEAAYPGGLLTHLDAIGLLSERLTVAHGGPSRRCRLRASGRTRRACVGQHLVEPAPAIRPAAHRAVPCATACASGLASTGMAFDDDEDALRELRVAWRLARGWGAEDVLSLDRLARCGADRRAARDPRSLGQGRRAGPRRTRRSAGARHGADDRRCAGRLRPTSSN